MKLSIIEIRDMVAEALRISLNEAKKKGQKVIPPRSEESIEQQRAQQTRATGYDLADALDFSQPLGVDSEVRKQGASGIGNWTRGSQVKAEQQIRALIRMIVAEEIRAIRES